MNFSARLTPFWLLVAGIFCTLQVNPAWAETLEEAKKAFEIEDKRLNEAWANLKKTLPDGSFEKVLAEQRGWLSYRDYSANEEARRQGGAKEGEEKTVPEYWTTQMYDTQSRIRMLKGLLDPGEYDDWSGEWIDGYGGLMQIVQQGDDTILFTIQVVRGPTYHLGAITGKAAVNRQLARFSDKGVASDKAPEDEETWLNFSLSVPRIEVTGANTNWYHGARAYFDGTYVRVAKLDEKQKAKVIAGDLEEDE